MKKNNNSWFVFLIIIVILIGSTFLMKMEPRMVFLGTVLFYFVFLNKRKSGFFLVGILAILGIIHVFQLEILLNVIVLVTALFFYMKGLSIFMKT